MFIKETTYICIVFFCSCFCITCEPTSDCFTWTCINCFVFFSYDLVPDCMNMMMMMLHTGGLTECMKRTTSTEGFLPVREWENRVLNILTMEKEAEFTAFQPDCQCVCVCEWVTSSLTSSSCQMSFSASPSCHTPSTVFKATGKKEEKKKALGHMWSQTHRVARRHPSRPPLSHWQVYEHAYALCYDVNKDSYGCYFEICTAKHFRPRGLMLLFFVNNWRKAVCGAW